MKIISFLFALTIIMLFSCSGECDPNAFVADIDAEIEKVNATGADFVNDTSEETCKAYKKAAENYLKAVEEYETCDGVDRDLYNGQLGQAKQLVTIIPCD